MASICIWIENDAKERHIDMSIVAVTIWSVGEKVTRARVARDMHQLTDFFAQISFHLHIKHN